VQLAAADKHVAELKQQLQDALEKLKLQSASGFPHSHRLYRITSGDARLMLLQLIWCCAVSCITCSVAAFELMQVSVHHAEYTIVALLLMTFHHSLQDAELAIYNTS